MAFAAAALPLISLAMTAAGSTVAAVGASNAAKATSNMYNYQSAVAQNNALIARRNADVELSTGEEKAQISGLQGKQKIGAIRAALGASGVAVDEGSSADVVAGEKYAVTRDQQIIRETAGRKATDFLTQQEADLSQAELDKMGAESAIQAGEFKTAGSLIGGATSVSDKWLQYNKLGVL